MDELLDTAPCGFVSFADDGKILLVNKTLATLLGHTVEDLLGLSVETLLSVGSRMFYQTHVFPLLKMSSRVEEIYLVLRSASGEDVPVLVNGVRHQRADGLANDCVLVPMRQRDRFEDELLLARKEAEKATRELGIVNEKLQQLDRFKDELLALTSHDLRSLITSIRLAGQMLTDPRRAGKIDTSRYLDIIVDSTNRLMILLEDISDLEMINTGGLRLSLEPVLMSEVVYAAVREQAVSAEAKSIAVNVTPADGEPFVEADYDRLFQVVGNLLGNAIKFTPVGGSIALNLRVEDEQVALVISDTGIGIPTTLLPNLFKSFKHVSRPGTAGERGSGLGLALVHRLVGLQGGTIEVDSEEGRGSTFTVRLPAILSQPQA